MKIIKITRRDHGFALVVTLSLMILLTVVAVDLLSLATISLRSTSNGDAAAQARSNARLALMLAIGELQREMGPDSRISAPHNVGGATGGQPHWTAVYDSWKRADGRETPEARTAKFRAWLVSGMSQSTPATTPGILLVGPGSLGPDAAAVDEVRVPSVVVNSANRVGNLAWWVADEGTKAKITAGPDVGGPNSFGTSDPLFQAQAPPNIGHQSIPVLAQLDWGQGVRAKTISNSQVNLAAGLPSRGLGTALHDITVHSAGVLADVRAGRLKRDLSNVLTRSAAQVGASPPEIQDKPLYLADGRINWLDIKKDGSMANKSFVRSWRDSYNSPDQWGINMEELYLFHSLHRQLSWTGNSPGLPMKGTRLAVVQDRHYMYRRPTVQALQFIFSLKAVPDTAAGRIGRYKMEINMDAMVSLSNPNDVTLTWPAGLNLTSTLYNLGYHLQWNIKPGGPGGTTNTQIFTGPPNFETFSANVGGSVNPTGFTLRPGEAATFGTGTAKGYELDLSRGFLPRGAVSLNQAAWNLKADNLLPTDLIDFEFKRQPRTGAVWNYFNTWIGNRGWQMDQAVLNYTGAFEGQLLDEVMKKSIRPPSVRPVSDFTTEAQPVLVLSFLQNVEEPTTGTADAFASRPYQLHDPALADHSYSATRLETERHAQQFIFSAESMDYKWRSIAAGDGGGNIYYGGGRQPNLGGSFNVVSRRIPIAPPLSLGAFQNAIASGFSDHFAEAALRSQVGGNPLAVGGDPFPASAVALTGHIHALPLVSKAIGNSNGIPHLALNEVFKAGDYITTARGATGNGKVATDHSWMVNTALWDTWFLSGIVDGTGSGSSTWLDDKRTPRTQFQALASGERPLRNTRYLFHPHKPVATALTELFSGENLDNAAVNKLPAYLMVDGAFNVNSTSIPAWTALLSSVRDQKIMTANGGSKSFNHPFGTLGYAVSQAIEGTEGDWSGLRDLNNAEIETLASRIVDQVKARGPFLSVADFVNRRPNSSNTSHQALGALQTAIDLSGLNDRFKDPNRQVTGSDWDKLAGSDAVESEPVPARAIGSAGHLSQGDLLTALGSQITVRSDTFVIRTYGDARSASGAIIAKAWCEAVVQRIPDYVDPTDSPEASEGWPQSSDKLAPANSQFGRRFDIRAFRWLNSDEI